MLACLLPFCPSRTIPAALPNNTPVISGKLSGRTLTAAPPAMPRISYHSPWWTAFRLGGLKGLLQRNIRKAQDGDLDQTALAVKKNRAKLDLSNKLKATFNPASSAKKADYLNNLQTSLENAVWYGVEVEEVVRSVFSEPTFQQGELIQQVCEGRESLAPIVNCLTECRATWENLTVRLKTCFLKSNEYSRMGNALSSTDQNALWSDTEKEFKVAAHFGLQEKICDRVLMGLDSKELIFFAKNKLLGNAGTFKILEKLCERAFAQLAEKKIINFTSLSKLELEVFGELAKNNNFLCFSAPIYKELTLRSINEKKSALLFNLDRDLSSLEPSKITDLKLKESLLKISMPADMTPVHIKEVIKKVILKLNPEMVIKMTAMDFPSGMPKLLIDAAKKFWAAPEVSGVDDTTLIAYLALAEAEISPSSRALFVKEATDRANTASKAATKLMVEQLGSDPTERFTYRNFVRAALKFCAFDKISADLQEAAGIKCESTPIEIDKGNEKPDEDIQKYKKLALRQLVIKLRRGYGKEDNDKADRIASFILRLYSGEKRENLVPLTQSDNKEIDEALSDYFSKNNASASSLNLKRMDAVLEKRFAFSFLQHTLPTTTSAKVTQNSEEFPVCGEYLRDTTELHLSVENVLIPNIVDSKIPTQSISRAQPFLAEMRKLKNVTDAQILRVSGIACQSTAIVFEDFIHSEKLFSLSSAEIESGDSTGARMSQQGLAPSNLNFEENITMQENGNLVVSVRAAQRNVAEWKGRPGTGTVIHTDPDISSFMARLKFEIDPQGTIRENFSIETGYQRSIRDYSI
jgi:hypothetical protein